MKHDPQGPAGGDDVEGAGAASLAAPPSRSGQASSRSSGALQRLDLARARAAHRPHASAARALRRHGLADRRRQRSTAPRRAAAARPCICTRARSWCRSTRTASRSASRAPVPAHMQERLDACGWTGECRLVDARRRDDQYSVALSRSGAARSCSSPPTLPLREIGEDRAGARQALALDVARRHPTASSARSPWRTGSRRGRP